MCGTNAQEAGEEGKKETPQGVEGEDAGAAVVVRPRVRRPSSEVLRHSALQKSMDLMQLTQEVCLCACWCACLGGGGGGGF